MKSIQERFSQRPKKEYFLFPLPKGNIRITRLQFLQSGIHKLKRNFALMPNSYCSNNRVVEKFYSSD
ncbi:hypothetical protein B1H38_11455 [Leptospira borgpetersenii serovar Ballum]|nr:hypothetical protein B1H38_11455 [Leptospira borgpetersenii serovar Ballum]